MEHRKVGLISTMSPDDTWDEEIIKRVECTHFKVKNILQDLGFKVLDMRSKTARDVLQSSSLSLPPIHEYHESETVIKSEYDKHLLVQMGDDGQPSRYERFLKYIIRDGVLSDSPSSHPRYPDRAYKIPKGTLVLGLIDGITVDDYLRLDLVGEIFQLDYSDSNE